MVTSSDDVMLGTWMAISTRELEQHISFLRVIAAARPFQTRQITVESVGAPLVILFVDVHPTSVR